MKCEHGVEYGAICVCSKCAEKLTVTATFSKPDDFRSHTCGECAWAHIIPSHAAYHQSIDKGEAAFICRHRSSDLMWPISLPACPAYVPREVAP